MSICCSRVFKQYSYILVVIINYFPRNEFDFYIKKLRPNEKVWFGNYIILKPKCDEIKISYKITSGNTDGSLAADLVGTVAEN